MKRILFFSTILSSLILTSCFNPVYYEIRKDVKPEEGTISGNISQITRTTVDTKEFLVLYANEGIRYKQKDLSEHGAWKIFDNPPCAKSVVFDKINQKYVGEQVVSIFSDKDTLFAITAKYKYNTELGTTNVDYMKVYGTQLHLDETDSSGHTWSTNNEWTLIIDDTEKKIFPFAGADSSSDYQSSEFAIFQTNSPIPEHRKVFIRSGKSNPTYYELSGIQQPVTTNVIITGKESNIANSAVYFNGEVLFFESLASTTNETYDSEATRFYFGNDNKLYANKQANSKEVSEFCDAENTISSLATCADSILIGRGKFGNDSSTYGGIAKTSLDVNGTPGNQLISFDTNASFQLSTAYLINCIINTSPEKNETASSFYSSVSIKGTATSTGASFRNLGLWSYYPSRGNWNRE